MKRFLILMLFLSASSALSQSWHGKEDGNIENWKNTENDKQRYCLEIGGIFSAIAIRRDAGFSPEEALSAVSVHGINDEGTHPNIKQIKKIINMVYFDPSFANAGGDALQYQMTMACQRDWKPKYTPLDENSEENYYEMKAKKYTEKSKREQFLEKEERYKTENVEMDYWRDVAGIIKKSWDLSEKPISHKNLVASVIVTIEKDGKVTRVRFDERSVNSSFDELVENVIKKASPFPPFPRAMKKEKTDVGIRLTSVGATK